MLYYIKDKEALEKSKIYVSGIKYKARSTEDILHEGSKLLGRLKIKEDLKPHTFPHSYIDIEGHITTFAPATLTHMFLGEKSGEPVYKALSINVIVHSGEKCKPTIPHRLIFLSKKVEDDFDIFHYLLGESIEYYQVEVDHINRIINEHNDNKHALNGLDHQDGCTRIDRELISKQLEIIHP